jgi:methyltransferase
MDAAVALLAFITLQRFVEFVWDRRNTRRLRAAGAVEFGGLHYPAMMLVHAGWLAGLWVFAYDSPVIRGYVAAFLVLQVGRYWVLAGAALVENSPLACVPEERAGDGVQTTRY